MNINYSNIQNLNLTITSFFTWQAGEKVESIYLLKDQLLS